MEEYSTFVAFLLILFVLDNRGEEGEYDILLIEHDLDIADEMYHKLRYQDTPVYSTIVV